MSNRTSTTNGTTSSGQDAGREEMYRIFMIWLYEHDVVTAKYYGFAMIGLILLFGIGHRIRRVIVKRAKYTNIFHKITRVVHTGFQKLNNPRRIGTLSVLPGHLLLAFTYFAILAALAFYDRPFEVMTVIQAKRFGWLALCNICLTIFLGLKVTPLQPFAGLSWDYLNVLHRVVGYTTIVLVLLHSTTYLAGLSAAEALHEVMTRSHNIAGIAAGVIMITIGLTSLPYVRKRWYEAFYASHLILVCGVIVAVALHRPDGRQVAILVTLNAALIWAPDKAIRLVRWIYFGRGNYCTLIPLPGGATRVTMNRRMKARPGSSAFLWIPSLRKFQRHPFTLVLTEPKAEFVVKARDGFTRDLYLAACKEPGAKLRASIEGPYGRVPHPNKYSKIILIAGGSGGTFAMSIALAWARKRRTPRCLGSLDFIWAVRNRAELDWFEGELAELKANSRVTVRLHVTSSRSAVLEASSMMAQPSKSHSDLAKLEVKATVSARSSDSNLKAAEMGRPDVGVLIREVMEGQERESRVLIAGCGPESLRVDIRKAVAACSRVEGPSVDVYLEEFSL